MKKDEEISAFLGIKAKFEGKLKFHGTLRIDGHFTGSILAGGTLIVGEEGIIEGDVHVSSLILRGEIRGDIVGDDRVEVHVPGKVLGDIQSPTFVIDEGVHLEGLYRTI
jgi:cytoskeletal protein CcmA (bactofilin family)